jgi:hypothetical protein
MLSDAWLLNVRKDAAWSWTALKYATASSSPVTGGGGNCAAGGEENFSGLTWCHPCCKVGDSVVFLSRGRKSVVRECSPDGRKANGEHRRRLLPNDASSSDSDDCSGAVAAAAAANERPPRHRILQAQDSRSSNVFLTSSSSANCDHQLHDGGVADDTASDSLSVRLNGATSDSSSSNSAVVEGANVRGQCSTAATSPCINGSSLNGGLPSVRPNARKNRQKQLEALRSYEQRLRERTLAAARYVVYLAWISLYSAINNELIANLSNEYNSSAMYPCSSVCTASSQCHQQMRRQMAPASTVPQLLPPPVTTRELFNQCAFTDWT